MVATLLFRLMIEKQGGTLAPTDIVIFRDNLFAASAHLLTLLSC